MSPARYAQPFSNESQDFPLLPEPRPPWFTALRDPISWIQAASGAAVQDSLYPQNRCGSQSSKEHTPMKWKGCMMGWTAEAVVWCSLWDMVMFSDQCAFGGGVIA